MQKSELPGCELDLEQQIMRNMYSGSTALGRQIQHKDGDVDGRPDGIYMSTLAWSTQNDAVYSSLGNLLPNVQKICLQTPVYAHAMLLQQTLVKVQAGHHK